MYLDAERRRAFVLEVKWTRAPVDAGVLADLRRRVALDPGLSRMECTCAVVSRAGFSGKATRADQPFLVDAGALVR